MNLGFEIKKLPGKGRSVIATRNFDKGEVIEICPVITFTPTERKQLEKTFMAFYIYPWKSTRSASLVFGYGSLINHSYDPNADWKQNFKTQSMVYKAIKPIKKGEEITVNYNGEPDDETEIDWFPDGEEVK